MKCLIKNNMNLFRSISRRLMSKCINNFIATPFLKWVKHIKEENK
jgi:hypothetical protein